MLQKRVGAQEESVNGMIMFAEALIARYRAGREGKGRLHGDTEAPKHQGYGV
jgi:hypothetical protein